MDNIILTTMKTSEEVALKIYNLLLQQLRPFLHNVQLEYKVFTHFSEFECQNVSVQSWKHSERSDICESIASAIACYLIEEEETRILRHLIINEFAYDGHVEVNKIMDFCLQTIHLEDDETTDRDRRPRQKTVTHEIKHYLKKNNYLNIDGLLQFRLKDYIAELREVVEYAIDEFIMDKQYQEFIALLKYFVYIQEAKIPVVHLMHKGGNEFVLLNDQMRPIETGDLESFSVEVLDKDFNFEDLIVSTLISVAPQKIYIHMRDPFAPVIQTIIQIFEDRTQLCEYCRQCIPILGEPVDKTNSVLDRDA